MPRTKGTIGGQTHTERLGGGLKAYSAWTCPDCGQTVANCGFVIQQHTKRWCGKKRKIKSIHKSAMRKVTHYTFFYAGMLHCLNATKAAEAINMDKHTLLKKLREGYTVDMVLEERRLNRCLREIKEAVRNNQLGSK